MPRTTLDLDSAVLRELRTRSRLEHKSMGNLASELLACVLSDLNTPASAPLRWVSRSLGTPRIDLDGAKSEGGSWRHRMSTGPD